MAFYLWGAPALLPFFFFSLAVWLPPARSIIQPNAARCMWNDCEILCLSRTNLLPTYLCIHMNSRRRTLATGGTASLAYLPAESCPCARAPQRKKKGILHKEARATQTGGAVDINSSCRRPPGRCTSLHSCNSTQSCTSTSSSSSTRSHSQTASHFLGKFCLRCWTNTTSLPSSHPITANHCRLPAHQKHSTPVCI